MPFMQWLRMSFRSAALRFPLSSAKRNANWWDMSLYRDINVLGETAQPVEL